MEEEVIDVKLGGGGEEKREKEQNLEEFLEKNKFTVGIFILGIVLLGLGVLGFKIFSFTANQPKVEILGSGDEKWDVSREMGVGSERMEVGKITVEAAGEVMKPGVYELIIGSRVNDLLTMAGGLSAGADREWVGKNVNLAQKLVDGAKIFVPEKGGSGELEVGSGSGSGSEKWGKININTASEAELDTLWGIGPATAKKIMEGRPYQRAEELLEKKIVKSNVWEEIKDKITVF